MSFVVRTVLNAVALWVTVQLVEGLAFRGGVWALLLVAAIFGIVNAVVRPLVTVLSVPLLVLTLGLFSLVINALMFALTIWLAEALGLGLSATGFGPIFLGAIVLAVFGWLLNLLRG